MRKCVKYPQNACPAVDNSGCTCQPPLEEEPYPVIEVPAEPHQSGKES